MGRMITPIDIPVEEIPLAKAKCLWKYFVIHVTLDAYERPKPNPGRKV